VKEVLETMKSGKKGLVGGRGGEKNFACMGRKVSQCLGIAVVGLVTWGKTDEARLCLACSRLHG
jgi:hypothetical protein